MRRLQVFIEINGENVPAGTICGYSSEDAVFAYAPEYLAQEDPHPISLSLPLQTDSFSAVRTRNYFEGLLPEGFLKMTVAQRMHIDESDYLAILSGLGRECLGALTVKDEEEDEIPPSYERLSMNQLREIAREGATRSVQLVTKAHLSLAGASGKVGLYYDPGEMAWYLPMGKAPSTHIVKQSHVRLDAIVTNEQLSLLTGKFLGIEIPESHIINMGNAAEGEVLFATRRYDRVFRPDREVLVNGLPMPQRLHQEDFAQALGIPAVSKYETEGGNYLPQMFRILQKHSANPIEDMLKLWDIVVYDYLIGNTDNHIKNISLLYADTLKTVRLAPAYDIISTEIYESSTRDMAFRIGGEINLDKIDRECFRRAAKDCFLGEKIAMEHYDRMVERFPHALEEAVEQMTAQGFAKAEELRERILNQVRRER